MEKFPKKIIPCPILEATYELRYESKFNQKDIYNIISEKFKQEYPTEEILPFFDNSLQFGGERNKISINQFSNDWVSISNGNNLLSLSNRGKYSEWKEYKNEFIKIIKFLSTKDVFSKVTRLGVRYIDFFEKNIFENINLSFIIRGVDKRGNPNYILTTEFYDKFIQAIQISNNLNITKGDEKLRGSIIDIDTYTEQIPDLFLNKLDDYLDDAHNLQKEYFFNLINEDYLINNFEIQY